MIQVSSRSFLALVAGLLLAVLPATTSLADGTETLGTPGDPIATGSGVVIGGVGLVDGQPASFDLDVPGDVVQVLLYFEGQTRADRPGGPDGILVLNGTVLPEAFLIGGPTQYTGPFITQSYRRDITDLGLVVSGTNTLTVEGLDFGWTSCGAGVLVIYDDGTEAVIDIRDGNDFAFNTPDNILFANDLQITEEQSFSFAPTAEDRVAEIPFFVASVADDRDPDSLEPLRPTVVVVNVGGNEMRVENTFSSFQGRFWDATTLVVDVPAGVGDLSVQILSRDELGTGFLPASLVWVMGGVSISDGPPVIEPPTKGKKKKSLKKKKKSSKKKAISGKKKKSSKMKSISSKKKKSSKSKSVKSVKAKKSKGYSW